jgi:hypothetical protein
VNWKQQQPMNIEETKTLPPLAFMGGTKVMTLTRVPQPEWRAEALIPVNEI